MNDDDIKVLTNVNEFVHSHPEMYWGKNNPTTDDVVNAMIEQIEILKCEPVIVHQENEWCFVGAEKDWLESALAADRDVKDLFDKGYGFPEAGGLSMRCEYFLAEFSEKVVLWRDNDVLVIKGEVENDLDMLVKIFKDIFKNSTVVCFSGNTYTE